MINSKQCITETSDGLSSGLVSEIFTENFSDPYAKLGRVQVAKYNLKMKTVWVYFALITLYFSGIGAIEFKRIVEKRWDEERNKTSTPSQTWLIPQPSSSSWGDSKDYNKVNLVKNIIGYKPRTMRKILESTLRNPPNLS